MLNPNAAGSPQQQQQQAAGGRGGPTTTVAPPVGQQLAQQMAAKFTLDEVILTLPVAHRYVVAELKQQLAEQTQKISELQTELDVSRTRQRELEGALASREVPQVRIVSAVKTLEELTTTLQQEHTAKVDTIQRRTAENVRQLEDPNFDAHFTLQQSTSRNMKPPPASYEYVDLYTMRESIMNDGYTPTNPVQTPLIETFVSQLDGIRQCSRDNRHAFMHRDATRAELLRRLYDNCKAVELKLGDTSHLVLPALAVTFDLATAMRESQDPSFLRSRETAEHVASINHCGEIFERAVKEVKSLDDQYAFISQLPLHVNDYETLLTTTHNEVENITHNCSVIRDGGRALIDTAHASKATLQEKYDSTSVMIKERLQERDALLIQMTRLLNQVSDLHFQIEELHEQNGKKTFDMAILDKRVIELSKVTETELNKQNKYQEGTRFTIYLLNKSRELYKGLYSNLRELMQNRHDLCQHTKTSSQEQLYSMAENLHDIITKRIQSDNLQIRMDQQALDAANRSLMGLVHAPAEMERAMGSIRQYTASIASAKQRMAQSQADIQTIRQIFQRYGTLGFLKRDSNFLSMFENVEKTVRLKERIDEMTQRVKFVSEVLVEISDPETRQEFVVNQCLEAIKQTVTDVNDILPMKARIEQLEETYRLTVIQRLRRHLKLVQHFYAELDNSDDDLFQKEPALQPHTQSLLTGLAIIMSALTHNDELLANATNQSAYINAAMAGGAGGGGGGAMGGGQQNYYDPNANAISLAKMQSDREMGVDGPAGGKGLFKTGPGLGGEGGARGLGGGGGPGGVGGGATVKSAAIDSLSPDFLLLESVQHTFARASDSLKLSLENRRITKLPGALEMSNTSALGSVGFRANSGIHKYSIRIGANCGKLLVGFADWNLPVDGYCNSLKYPTCYYLHVGNGTLWSPDLKYERKPFTFEAIGSTVGGILSCIVDTNERTIGFVWGEQNLGVAFRGINVSRTLYPAFELYSNNTTFEFLQAARAEEAPGAGSGLGSGLGGLPRGQVYGAAEEPRYR